MPRKYKTQQVVEAQMRKILLEAQLLNLADEALKNSDSTCLSALMKALEKLISVQWVKFFYCFNSLEAKQQILHKRLCCNLRMLVELPLEQKKHRYKLGDSYRVTLLAVMKLMDETGIDKHEINEIVNGRESDIPA